MDYDQLKQKIDNFTALSVENSRNLFGNEQSTYADLKQEYVEIRRFLKSQPKNDTNTEALHKVETAFWIVRTDKELRRINNFDNIKSIEDALKIIRIEEGNTKNIMMLHKNIPDEILSDYQEYIKLIQKYQHIEKMIKKELNEKSKNFNDGIIALEKASASYPIDSRIENISKLKDEILKKFNDAIKIAHLDLLMSNWKNYQNLALSKYSIQGFEDEMIKLCKNGSSGVIGL